MSQNDEIEGLRELITRIAEAADRGSQAELNAALSDFTVVMFPELREYVGSQLRKRAIGGPDGAIAEADDVLNRLLLKLVRVASYCPATDDEGTTNWVKAVINNLTRDETRTSRRRFWLLIERLRKHGYHHGSWDSNTIHPEQDTTHDQTSDG